MSIETWESVYDLVESIIKDGHMACKRRWFSSETLVAFLDFPLLDPIDEARTLKLKLELIESDFPRAKKQI